MITILDARPGDAETIRNIAEETWWPTYSPIVPAPQIRYMLDNIYDAGLLRRMINDGEQSFILIADENGFQGFAAWSPRPDEPGVNKLHKLYIRPGNQGKGYGARLVDEIRRRLLENDCHTLDLNVNRNNKALGFYEKMGFTVIRQEDIPMGQYWMNDYVMRLTF